MSSKEEDKNMIPLSDLAQKETQETTIDRSKLRAKAERLKIKNGVIILDTNNPEHREWYNEED